jgi:hypothetical protein
MIVPMPEAVFGPPAGVPAAQLPATETPAAEAPVVEAPADAGEPESPVLMPAWPTSAIHQPGMPPVTAQPADRIVAHAPLTGRQPPVPGAANPISALPSISALPPISSPPSSPAPAGGTPFSTPQGRSSAGTVYPSSGRRPAPVNAQPAVRPPAPAQPTPSSRYGEWARSQRPQGTVYGRGGSVPVAVFPSGTALENSGSLTGHILSQGAADVPPPKSRTARVIVIIVVILLILVAG